MKIAITGGLGFIGSNLALELQNRIPESQIDIIDNAIGGDFRNLSGFKGPLTLNPNYDVKYDIIFHLGALTDTTNSSLKEHLKNNAYYYMSLKNKETPIIYASSASVYGVGATRPSKETDDLKPANEYAFSKMQLEKFMQSRYPNSIGFRFFNIYGPKEQHKGHAASMVSQILNKVKKGENINLFRDGNQRRDFIYVKDVVNLLIKAGTMGKFNPGIYNLGTGASISFNEIFKNAKTLFPESKSEINWIDNKYSFFQEFTQADMSKTIETFNWRPEWIPIDGMRDYKDTL